jgi:hypothetical protein
VFITFGLGGSKAQFLRLGFGAEAQAPAEVVHGGFQQWRPVLPTHPILVHARFKSRVGLRLAIRSRTSCVHRLRTSIGRRRGAGGYAAGGPGERAFNQLHYIVRGLSAVATTFAKWCDGLGDRTMTNDDRRLVVATAEFLAVTMTHYRTLVEALQEPRAPDIGLLERRLRAARDERDLRDLQAIQQAIDART